MLEKIEKKKKKVPNPKCKHCWGRGYLRGQFWIDGEFVRKDRLECWCVKEVDDEEKNDGEDNVRGTT